MGAITCRCFSTTVTWIPWWVRFSIISRPMKPPPTTTALRGALLWMNVCSRSVSSTVRRVNTRADSTPGRAGRSGLAPGERSSLS